jgi:hypothetical protein
MRACAKWYSAGEPINRSLTMKCTHGQETHVVISFEPSRDAKTILQRHDGKPFITLTLPKGKTMDEALFELRAIALETYKDAGPGQ